MPIIRGKSFLLEGLPVLKDLIRLPRSKYRRWAILGAVGLSVFGVFLLSSVIMAFLDSRSFLVAPGAFFVRSYGLLALVIPAYVLYSAFLLADPAYKPERIFILCAYVFPFLTLAVGSYWLREFDVLSIESSFITRVGRIGIGFFVFTLTTLEFLVIFRLRKLLFSKNSIENEEKEAPKPLKRKPATGNLKEIYTEAAALMAEENENKNNIDDIEEITFREAEKAGGDYSDNLDVEKALAEAEVFASAHEEQVRIDEKNAPSIYKKLKAPYFVPVDGLLTRYPDGEYWIVDDETRRAALTLKETFKEFNIQVEVTGIRKGPVITMFEILPAPGIRLTKIENLADNIALRLAAQSVRIVAPIPGKHAVGIEVPNAKRNIVSFREIIEGELSREGKKAEIPVILGKDITGEAVTVDLVQMPHILIAGATGSGKSVCVNAMILTILYQKAPSECRLILIDPKIVELKLYNDIPHLLTPVITEPKKAFQALQYCIFEMERRYACLDRMGVRDIRSYNNRIKERDIATEYIPYIVVVIDEFADLMATTGKEMESTVARLAAMSRAVGIHLVLATQRPSIDVITGLIKANIPSRIAFMVAGRMNSQIIIDTPGAEKLLGKGDMLYAGAIDPFPVRMQGAFVSEEEVERVVDYVKGLGEPDYIDDEIFFDDEEEDTGPSLFSDGDDPLYEKALEIVLQQGKASASYIQRRLKIGYNRAARLVEEMEHHGVVGPAQGSRPRELLRAPH